MFHIGHVIRDLRNAQRLRLVDLAARAAISKMTLSAIERGSNRNYRRSTLDAIATALGTTVEGLSGTIESWSTASAAGLNEDEWRVVRGYRVMSAENQKAVLDYVTSVAQLAHRTAVFEQQTPAPLPNGYSPRQSQRRGAAPSARARTVSAKKSR